MIWTHVWLRCGRWTWRLLTLHQWRALPHLTPDMIAWRMTKAAVGGVIGLCAGGGAYYGPGLISGPPVARLPPAVIARHGKPVSTPEPWSSAVLAVGAAGIIAARRKRL